MCAHCEQGDAEEGEKKELNNPKSRNDETQNSSSSLNTSITESLSTTITDSYISTSTTTSGLSEDLTSPTSFDDGQSPKPREKRPRKRQINGNSADSMDIEARLVALSKRLTYVLRHGAIKEGIAIRADGSIKLEDLLQHPRFSHQTKEEIEQVIQKDDNPRFSIFEENGEHYIRALTNHSIQLDLEISKMTPVYSIEDLLPPSSSPAISSFPSSPSSSTSKNPVQCMHATYYRTWAKIQQRGLAREKKKFIYFTTELPKDSLVLLGMSSKSDVIIYLDLELALRDGIRFYRIGNIIASPGNEQGLIETYYFKSVKDVITGYPMPFLKNRAPPSVKSEVEPQVEQQPLYISKKKVPSIDLVATLATCKTALAEKNYTECIEHANEILRVNPLHLETLIMRIVCRIEQQEFAKALVDLETSLDLDSLNSELWYYRSLAKQHLQQYESVLSDIDHALFIDASRAKYWFLRAYIKLSFSQYESSIADFSESLKRSPREAEYWYYRGLARHKQQKYPQLALIDYHKAIELNPYNATYWFQRGKLKHTFFMEQEQSHLDTLNDYCQALQLNSSMLECRFERAQLYKQLKQNQKAIDDCTTILLQNSSKFDAWKLRGSIHYEQESFDHAISDFTEALRLSPNDWMCYKMRASSLKSLNKYQAALQDFRQARLINPCEELDIEIDECQIFTNVTEPSVLSESARTTLSNCSESQAGETTPSSQEVLIPYIKYEDIKIEKPAIGKGSFGFVYKAKWKGLNVALKKYNDVSREQMKDFEKELAIMQSLRNDRLVMLYGITYTEDDVPCIVMEYMEKGSLFDVLYKQKVPLSLDDIKYLALDIITGIHYLHSQEPKIIHRDIKSPNILIHGRNELKAKIGDFGLAKILFNSNNSSTSKNTGQRGTICWMASEVIKGQKYNEKVDIYSFGMVLYELIARELPFQGMNEYQIMHKVVVEMGRPVIPVQCHPDIKKLIESCWQDDPDKRPSTGQIMDILSSL